MAKYYLAYGSNLNLMHMRVRCPGARLIGKATLENHSLMFKGAKDHAYLTIEEKVGSAVPVAVWEVSQRNEKALDWYEGFPHLYFKKTFVVNVQDKKSGKTSPINAFAYIMTPGKELGEPSGTYLKACLDGYDMLGFDAEVLLNAYRKSKEAVAHEA